MHSIARAEPDQHRQGKSPATAASVGQENQAAHVRVWRSAMTKMAASACDAENDLLGASNCSTAGHLDQKNPRSDS